MECQTKSPNVVGLCVVKNEQDIIESFVRHNLRFLDSLLVLDNGSADNTWEILKELTKEFRGLVLGQDDEFAHTQSARTTRMFRSAQLTYNPDYIMPLDADEFIGVAERSAFWAILQQIPHGGYGLMPMRTFVITPDTVTISAEDPPRSLQWRRREESPVFYKIVLRPDGQDVNDLVIEHGNHHVKSVCGREIPCVKLEELSLMHVPVRSRDQFIAKIIVGWMASLARDPAVRSSGLTWHKRDDFDRIANGRVIDDKALCEFSFLYAQSSKSIDWRADVVKTDLPFDYVRRYSTGKPLNAIQLIARSWERSLQIGPREMDSEGAFYRQPAAKMRFGNHEQGATTALAILLDLHQRRPDLQSAFPEAIDSECSRLINWALGVCARRWHDADYETLRPYGKWYSILSDQERRQRDKDTAIAERDQPIAEKKSLQALLLLAEDRLRREQTTRMAMERSLSWQVTEPMRRFLTALRAGPRKSG